MIIQHTLAVRRTARRRSPAARTFGACLVSGSVMLWAASAAAQTVIGAPRTTAISTSTASNGSPDDVTISSAGSVTPPAGAAVTLDSNNAVSNAGTIRMQDIDDSTGVLILGGHAGGVTNSAAIEIDDTYTATDTDGDGDIDGQFANGARRYGVRLTGTSPFTGSIVNAAGATILVEGADSAGVSLEAGLAGTLSNLGSITATGTRAIGIHTTGAVSGDISIMGAIAATGEGARAVVLEGDVLGGVVIQSTITATGYRYTTRGTAAVLAKLDSDDLLQGGAALTISGNLGKGLFIDAPPVESNAASTDDDGDGVADASEATGTVVSYGGSPAIVIGAQDKAIALGNVGTGLNGYGVVIRGNVSAQGVYDGVPATAVQIGLPGGGAVTTGGGVRVAGSLGATTYSGDAIGLVLNAGASAPIIANEGTISAAVTSDGLYKAQALLLAAGANAPVLANSGAIAATLSGEAGDAVAIRDLSGKLTTIQTVGTISAIIVPTDDAADTDDADLISGNEVITGKAIAVDVSTNTTGVSLLQYAAAGATVTPSITGALLFGSGADRLDVLAGTVKGDISFGAGANSLTIDGGATVKGALTATGGTVALSIAKGGLDITNLGVLNLSSLSLGAASSLTLTLDPAGAAQTRLQVAGAATIAPGATIAVRLTSLLKTSGSYTLISAPALSASGVTAAILGGAPYIYDASVTTSPTAVQFNLSRKTAAQLGLSTRTGAAYEPLVAVLDSDPSLREAMLSQTDRAGFVKLYNQLLPNRSGSIFQSVAASGEAFGRAVDEREGAGGGGAWLQQVNLHLVKHGDADLPGYKARGFGLVGGVEHSLGGLGAAGVTFGYAATTIDDDDTDDSETLNLSTTELGAYWRKSLGGFTANARVAGDYLRVKSRRTVTFTPYSGTPVQRLAAADWSGAGITAQAHLAYEAHLGPSLYLRPLANLDYYGLVEDSYAEDGGGDAVNLAVDKRNSSRLSGLAGVSVGATFGNDAVSWWGPELLVGWRQVASETLGDTTAKFKSGGASFDLLADRISGGGPAARLSLKGENGFGGVVAEVGAERRDSLSIYDLRLAVHLLF